MNRLLGLGAVSGLAGLLFVGAVLTLGFGSPLTWAVLAAWALTDLMFVATMMERTRSLRRGGGGGETRPPKAAPGRAHGVGSDSVILKGIGHNKIDVIRVIRGELGLGLREAKDLADAVEKAPIPVAANLDRVSAERMLRALLDAGADAEMLTAE
ncbi:MAG TPA: ribosomal protein L7/L12 [Tepidiformaceae bacterium]|nr:ribosomal protein L7/L12 [Tepidiformaceae bacterium]